MATDIVLRVLGGWTVLACILGPLIGRRLRRMNGEATNHKTAPGGTR